MPALDAAEFSGHRVIEHPGDDHAAPRQRPGRWICDREPDGRRPQRASARQASTQCCGRTRVWRTRPGQPCRVARARACPSGWPADYGKPKSCDEALDEGAAGVQVGTAFAFSEESGLRPDLKKMLLAQAAARRRRGVHRSAGLAYRLSVQSRAARGNLLVCGSLRASATASATWAFCAKPMPTRADRLSLSG